MDCNVKGKPQGGDSERKPTGGPVVFLGSKILSRRYFLGVIKMPGIFSGWRHISGIFARIQVFLKVINHDFVKNHENVVVFWSISYIAGACGQPCVTHFATMSIFEEFRYFLGVIILFSHWPPCQFTWWVQDRTATVHSIVLQNFSHYQFMEPVFLWSANCRTWMK